MVYLNDDIIRKLTRLQTETNEILRQWQNRNAPIDAVNVADLVCVSAGIAMIHIRSFVWTVTVSECAPDAHEFQLWLAGELHKFGYDAVEVYTEW